MGFADRFDALNNHVTLFFLRFVGPPSVGSPDGRGRAASEDERAREVDGAVFGAVLRQDDFVAPAERSQPLAQVDHGGV